MKIVGKIAINIASLYGLAWLFPGFTIVGDWRAYLLGGIVLAAIYLVLRPVLKLLSFPLILLTFGLFNIVISIVLLLVADYFLTELAVTGFWTYVWSAVLLGIANSII